ncbi:Wzy polymerase domain-containing protein [Neptuniibacter sp. QD29_5]|uniref:PglL family O-oligosaccharyltransferase n=1 Tax=Neptuniibacter sp. QD29_5 TaxID=3398207 RepID=UPI0039F612C7
MTLRLELEKDPSLKKPQKVFFVLFGIMFLVAPFYYQPNLGGEGLNVPHNSSLWIVASWIIAAACFIIYKNDKIILPRYWLALALLPLGAILTSYIADNNNPAEWLVRLSVICGGYLFFIALFQFQLTSRQIERSLYILLSMGLLAAVYGVIQTQNIPLLLNIVPRGTEPLAIGVFQQVNIQAAVMATTLTLVFYLISRPTHKSLNPIILIALVITALVTSYNITISGSRVGLLGISCSLLMLLIGRGKLLLNSRLPLMGVIVASLIGGYLGSHGLESATKKFNRALATEGIGGVKTDIRWNIYKTSWELYTEAPIFGHGIGSFQKVFQDKRAKYQRNGTYNLGKSPKFSHPHNEIIFWLIEGGSFAIIGILAAALFTFIQLIKLGWQRGFGYAALLVPITLHTQVELPFYISNTPWFLLLTILFLVHQSGKKTFSTSKLSKAAGKAIPISATVMALVTTNTLVQAQVGNAGLINYFGTAQQKPIYLQSSLKSQYFEDYTTFLLLRRNMFMGISQNNPKHAIIYANWAEDQIKVNPALIYYRNLAIAYDYTNRNNERDKIMKIAMSTYLNNLDLQQLNQQFMQKDLEDKNSSAVIKQLDTSN